MRLLFSIPSNGYLVWRISKTASLKHCLNQYRTYFSAIAAVQEIHKDVYRKPVLDLKNRKNIHSRKNFPSNNKQSFALMNFDVWMYPGLFQLLKDICCVFDISKTLGVFSASKFISCSEIALQVVTTLLSQFRFPELKGLLTPECQEEVQENLRRWTKNETSVLSFEPEHLIKSVPCDFRIFSVTDEENKKKKFLEIRVIHYVWVEYTPRFQKEELSAYIRNWLLTHPTTTTCRMVAVYNCKFVTEITSGFIDQWTINKINLKMCPNIVKFFKK